MDGAVVIPSSPSQIIRDPAIRREFEDIRRLLASISAGAGADGQPGAAGATGATGPAGSGGVPAGCIIMWAGTIAGIPSGYALCDGTAGTPDLRDRFVTGAAAGADAGATGGASTHTHVTHTSDGVHTHNSHGAAAVPAGVGVMRFSTPTTHSDTGTGHTHNAHDSPNHLPPYYAVLFIQKT